LILFAVAYSPAAFSQSPQPFVAVAAPVTLTAEAPAEHEMYLIHKVLGMVGPSEPAVLTESERFQQYLLSVGGPVPLLGEAAAAGFGQWTDHPREWGEGWGAYGERYGSNLAYNGVRQTITYAASIALHEDNRYFPSHSHGFWGRSRYAIVSTFAARRPDGQQAFSVSSVSGVIGASAISSMWGPDSSKGYGNIAENAGISFAATAALNLVREFLPDMLHHPRTVASGTGGH